MEAPPEKKLATSSEISCKVYPSLLVSPCHYLAISSSAFHVCKDVAEPAPFGHSQQISLDMLQTKCVPHTHHPNLCTFNTPMSGA